MHDWAGYVKNIALSMFDQFDHFTFEGVRGPGWQGDIAINEVSIRNCGGGGGGECGECLFVITSPIVI